MVHWLVGRSKISITTFFQICFWSINIDFIPIFRFERFHTIYNLYLGYSKCRNFDYYTLIVCPYFRKRKEKQKKLDNGEKNLKRNNLCLGINEIFARRRVLNLLLLHLYYTSTRIISIVVLKGYLKAT